MRIDNVETLTRDNFDFLLCPGGFAPNILEALGDEGETKLKNFVGSGGGFAGLCVGAYLGSNWGWDS